MLTLVDFFGASMIALVLGIAELYTIGWIYGTDRLCKDIEFMLGRKVGLYWRLCWGVFTPLIMTVILIYFYATYEPLTYNKQLFPTWAYGKLTVQDLLCFTTSSFPFLFRHWLGYHSVRHRSATHLDDCGHRARARQHAGRENTWRFPTQETLGTLRSAAQGAVQQRNRTRAEVEAWPRLLGEHQAKYSGLAQRSPCCTVVFNNIAYI